MTDGDVQLFCYVLLKQHLVYASNIVYALNLFSVFKNSNGRKRKEEAFSHFTRY